jgi:hypothetical protein
MVKYEDYVLPTWQSLREKGICTSDENSAEVITEKMRYALANPELFAVWPLHWTIPKHQGYWLRLMAENPELELIAPVDHGKTSCAIQIYTLWKLARNKNLRIGLVGYNDSILTGALRNIQYQLENNTDLQLFGLKPDSDQKKWREDLCYIERDDKRIKDPTYVVLGRGSTIENRRLDVAIFDDIINFRDYIKSRNIHNRLQRWYLEQVIPRFRPPAEIKIIGTYQADDDFYEWLAKGEIDEGETINTDLKVVAFSSLVEKGRSFVVYDSENQQPKNEKVALHIDLGRLYTEPAYKDNLESLWPESWPSDKLVDRLHRIGKRAAARKYLGLKVSDTGSYFSINEVFTCKDPELTISEGTQKLPVGMRIFFGLDPSTGDGASWCSLFVLGVKDDEHYLLKFYRGKYRFPEIKALLYDKFFIWHPERITVENNACQGWLRQDMSSEPKYALLPIEAHYTGNKKWDPDEGVPYLSTLLQNRKMHIPDKMIADKVEVEPFIEELRYFPTGQSSDVLMSWYLAEIGYMIQKDVKSFSYENPFSGRHNRRRMPRLSTGGSLGVSIAAIQ